MNVREEKLEYEVVKHGSTYVEPEKIVVYPCPECCGTNCVDIEEELNRNPEFCYDGDGDATYLCKDCGCEFDACISNSLTERGEKLESFFEIATTVFALLCAATLSGGLFVWLFVEVLKYFLFGLAAAVIFGILAFVCGKAYEKI